MKINVLRDLGVDETYIVQNMRIAFSWRYIRVFLFNLF